MANTENIDRLLQFALLTAGQEDEYADRWLSPIHLIKYVYLADLAFAQRNEGETFTGLAWKFHHYGPWEPECFLRIEPALTAIDAEKRTISSTHFEDDYDRWCARHSRLHGELQQKLPIGIVGTIEKSVHRFGSDTKGLLHHVYATPPMIIAAPGELLDFSESLPETKTETPVETDRTCKLSPRQMKKRKEALRNLKSGLRAMLDKRKQERASRPVQPPFVQPRYDEIFVQGLEDLDRLAGSSMEEGSYKVIFSDDVWKSKSRFDPELS